MRPLLSCIVCRLRRQRQKEAAALGISRLIPLQGGGVEDRVTVRLGVSAARGLQPARGHVLEIEERGLLATWRCAWRQLYRILQTVWRPAVYCMNQVSPEPADSGLGRRPRPLYTSLSSVGRAERALGRASHLESLFDRASAMQCLDVAVFERHPALVFARRLSLSFSGLYQT